MYHIAYYMYIQYVFTYSMYSIYINTNIQTPYASLIMNMSWHGNIEYRALVTTSYIAFIHISHDNNNNEDSLFSINIADINNLLLRCVRVKVSRWAARTFRYNIGVCQIRLILLLKQTLYVCVCVVCEMTVYLCLSVC